jgi:E3 ubiquitin-protein ligase DOA10
MEGVSEKGNPILTDICKCTGNVSAVHLECLKFWINQNITAEETHYGIVLKWTKAFECQICKDALPMRLIINNRIIEMFTLIRPEIPYIILEVHYLPLCL